MPAGLLGAAAAIWLADLSNGIYFQSDIIAIMGLTAKNSILIIVFANELMTAGKRRARRSCWLRDSASGPLS